MIPPPSPELLICNRLFARLYSLISHRLLDNDCSTRALNDAYSATANTMHRHQVQETTETILLSCLDDLIRLNTSISDSNGGRKGLDDDESRELVDLVVSYVQECLAGRLSSTEHENFQPEMEDFVDRLPTISDGASWVH